MLIILRIAKCNDKLYMIYSKYVFGGSTYLLRDAGFLRYRLEQIVAKVRLDKLTFF